MTAPATGLVTAATNPDLPAAITALADADPAYDRAGRYYSGDVAEVFASTRLRRAMERTGMRFVFNFARLPVDAVAERVTLSAVTAKPDTAQNVLEQCWTRNKGKLLSKQIMRNAFKLGDAYALVWPSPDDDGQVDVFYNSPRSMRLFYDEENPRTKLYAVKKWQIAEGVRTDLLYPDRIEKYLRLGAGQQSKWVQWVDDDGDQWPYDNPFGEIPVFHFRTDDPYGRPEHADFYGPQDAIHKLIVSHMAGVDYQAFPQRWALREMDSDTSEAADADEDMFAFGTDTGATAGTSGDGRSQLQADPGSLWELSGFKGVGQFDAAQPEVFTNPLMVYLRMGAQITNTPLFRIDPTGSVPSGESRRVAEAPFVAKCNDRAERFEDTWDELVRFVCKVTDTPVESVDVQWDPMQATDDQDTWQVLQAKLAAGMPPQQAFIEAGYSSDQVEEWFGEDESGDLERSADLLVKVGQALSSLGTAVSLGALSELQLQALIAAILGDPDDDGTPGLPGPLPTPLQGQPAAEDPPPPDPGVAA